MVVVLVVFDQTLDEDVPVYVATPKNHDLRSVMSTFFFGEPEPRVQKNMSKDASVSGLVARRNLLSYFCSTWQACCTSSIHNLFNHLELFVTDCHAFLVLAGR